MQNALTYVMDCVDQELCIERAWETRLRGGHYVDHGPGAGSKLTCRFGADCQRTEGLSLRVRIVGRVMCCFGMHRSEGRNSG